MLETQFSNFRQDMQQSINCAVQLILGHQVLGNRTELRRLSRYPDYESHPCAARVAFLNGATCL